MSVPAYKVLFEALFTGLPEGDVLERLALGVGEEGRAAPSGPSHSSPPM
jgi:hypothetical protein